MTIGQACEPVDMDEAIAVAFGVSSGFRISPTARRQPVVVVPFTLELDFEGFDSMRIGNLRRHGFEHGADGSHMIEVAVEIEIATANGELTLMTRT